MDLLAVQGTLKSLLQHHSSKASVPRHSAFFLVQLSHPYMTTENMDLVLGNSALMEESKEELKRLLMRVKEENEKAGLKSSIQKTKIRAFSPIASWQIDGKKWKQ